MRDRPVVLVDFTKDGHNTEQGSCGVFFAILAVSRYGEYIWADMAGWGVRTFGRSVARPDLAIAVFSTILRPIFVALNV
jgi:hypothetical protein